MNNRQLTIAGLTACGWIIDSSARTSKYVTFVRPGSQQRLFVGKSGALRWSLDGRISTSRSMTNGKRHRAYREVGDPSFHFESVEQAVSVYHRILKGS